MIGRTQGDAPFALAIGDLRIHAERPVAPFRPTDVPGGTLLGFERKRGGFLGLVAGVDVAVGGVGCVFSRRDASCRFGGFGFGLFRFDVGVGLFDGWLGMVVLVLIGGLLFVRVGVFRQSGDGRDE